MESDLTPQQALADAERATASVWIDYPPTPAWYYPASGAWHAGLVLALCELHDSPLPLLGAVAVLMGLLGAWLAWYTRYRGTYPRISGAPPEFRPAMAYFLNGYAALLAVAAVLCVTVGSVVATAVTLVGMTAAFYLYERAYERAAAAARERLG